MMRFIHRPLFSLTIVLMLFGVAGAQAASYTVQFAASPAKEEAEQKVKQLKAKDVNAYIVKSVIPGKGAFYRVRAGIFSSQSEAKKFGAALQQRGVVSEFFITNYEKPTEETVAGSAPKGGPQAQVTSKTNQTATNNPPAATSRSITNTSGSPAGSLANNPANKPAGSPAANPSNHPSNNPSNNQANKPTGVAASTAAISPAPKPTTNSSTNLVTNPANTPGLNASVGSVPATTTPAASAPPSGFSRFQDSKIGYSFDYPEHWTGQPLTEKEASEQRMSAGATFMSQKDAAFLSAIWNELDKANNPASENDLIVEVILKSMSAGDGTKLEELARRVENQNGSIKTYLDLKAAFQTQGQTTPLDFLGKAVIIRASRGILLVVAFYSKDAPPNAAVAAERIIASARAPQ